MALTAQFSFGAPCAGDNHIPVTLVVTPGADVSFTVTKAEINVPLTSEDKETFARLLLRAYRAQLSGSTAAQIKTAVEAKTLDLTVTG